MTTLFHKEKVYSSSRRDLLSFQKITNKQHNGEKFFHHSRHLITDYLQGKCHCKLLEGILKQHFSFLIPFEPEINKMIEQFLTEYTRQRLWNYVSEYKEICWKEPHQHENKRPWLGRIWCRQMCSLELLAIEKGTDGNSTKFAWIQWHLAVNES